MPRAGLAWDAAGEASREEGLTAWDAADEAMRQVITLFTPRAPGLDGDGTTVVAFRTGQPLEALHLVAIALGAEPDARSALKVKRDASRALLAASGGTNLSETMWLKSEIAEIEAKLG